MSAQENEALVCCYVEEAWDKGNLAAVAENLAKLKELLEEGRVILQNGRQVTL